MKECFFLSYSPVYIIKAHTTASIDLSQACVVLHTSNIYEVRVQSCVVFSYKEYILERVGLFKISKNKTSSKIHFYMVVFI